MWVVANVNQVQHGQCLEHVDLKLGRFVVVNRAIDEQTAPIKEYQRVDPYAMVRTWLDFSPLKQRLVLVVDWVLQGICALVEEPSEHYGQRVDQDEDEDRGKLLPEALVTELFEVEHCYQVELHGAQKSESYQCIVEHFFLHASDSLFTFRRGIFVEATKH